MYTCVSDMCPLVAPNYCVNVQTNAKTNRECHLRCQMFWCCWIKAKCFRLSSVGVENIHLVGTAGGAKTFQVTEEHLHKCKRFISAVIASCIFIVK